MMEGKLNEYHEKRWESNTPKYHSPRHDGGVWKYYTQVY